MNSIASLGSGPWGQAFVFLNVFLNQLGLPIPAEPTLIIAGAASSGSFFAESALILAATLACMFADVIWFIAGRRYGSRILEMLCRLSLTPDICVGETHVRFERWGPKALLFSKFIPALSLLAPPLAGALKMRWSVFLPYTALSCLIWVSTFVIGGVLFEHQIDAAIPFVVAQGSKVVLPVGLLLAAFIGLKWWERRRMTAAANTARITVEELRTLMDAGAAPVIVDVRSHTARRIDAKQIAGAIHLVPGQFEVGIPTLPKDRDIILYCACPNEASAAKVARLLTSKGLTRVRPLRGGLDAWVEGGHPTESLAQTEDT